MSGQFDLPPLSDLARRQLRVHRAAITKRTSQFSTTGMVKSNVKPKAQITLRRADYERQKSGHPTGTRSAGPADRSYGNQLFEKGNDDDFA